jgi:TM2 domain-containing membrane protein YozV
MRQSFHRGGIVNYYVAEGTTQRGPLNEQELAGVGLRADSLVWHEGMPQWLPASQVPELLPFLGGQPQAQPVAGQPVQGDPTSPFVAPSYATLYGSYLTPSDIAGKKIAAGICGIIIGTFGVHKFIVGLNGGAVTMLVTSLSCIVLGFFTCGLTFMVLPIMHIIGLVEGIIYLTKSDAEFYQIYMVQKRQWF